MNYSVNNAVTAAVVLCLLGGIALPILLFWYLNRKKHASPKTFFAGWLAFLIAVTILERLFHMLVLSSSVGTIISGNLFLYALYGGLAAGLFEELARYFCFSRFLKKETDHDWNALMYGAGHGGSELFNIFVAAMINNLIYIFTIKNGGAEELLQGLSGDLLTQTEAVLAALSSTPAYMYILSFIERLSALAVQLSLSVLVFYAVKNPQENRRLLLIAVELHALIDFMSVILGALIPTVWTEAAIVLMAAGVVWFARMVWNRNHAAK